MKYKDSTHAETMRVHIEACKASGLTVSDYCKSHDLATSKFYYWQKRLSSLSGQTGFTQISAVIDTMVATIHFPNGVRITFAGGVRACVLKELACCI